MDACSYLGEVAELPQEIKQSSQQKEGKHIYIAKNSINKRYVPSLRYLFFIISTSAFSSTWEQAEEHIQFFKKNKKNLDKLKTP